MLAWNEWLLTSERVAVHAATATAVIADVHLGYCEARRWGGDAVPLVGVAEQLRPLAHVAQTHDLRWLIVAGDLFEAGHHPAVLAEFLTELRALGVALLGVVPGNHDRRLPDDLPLYPDGIDLDGWRIVHGDQELPAGKIVFGHFHPSVRWRGRKRPCYLTRPDGLVLPAFSRDAAGTNVAKDSCWSGWRRLVIDGNTVRALATAPARRTRR